ncbi:hypothetical protein [Streptosporangium roseum]|uniref:hypothetical protein n=1 Tax=Streptosporangium roseum TaxID=2001 RepID=UPI00332BEB5C
MTEQSPPTFTLAEARAELAQQECRLGHDFEHIEVITPSTGEQELTGVLCPRCGRRWSIARPDVEEVAGYLVVDTSAPAEDRGRWITPRMRDTAKEADADRAFWSDATGRLHIGPGPFRLAKVVLLTEEDQPVSEEDAATEGGH